MLGHSTTENKNSNDFIGYEIYITFSLFAVSKSWIK